MQRGRHVDRAVIIVGAFERDIFGGEIGADTLQELLEVHARPLPDVVPAFHADVADDPFLLGQRIDFPRGPWFLVLNLARKLQFPGGDVDRGDIFDVVVGVEARRLDDHGFREGRR